MPGFIQTDEAGTAEKLIAEAEKASGKPLDFGEEIKPAKEGQNESGEAEAETEAKPKKEGETPAQTQQVVDYMAQAVERAKQELKHKTELTDKEINDHIYQRFLTAGKKIQREAEARKALEQALEGHDPKDLVRYHREMESNDIIKALRAGRKFKDVTDEDGEYDEERRTMSLVEKKLNEVLMPIQQQQREAETRAGQQAKQAQLVEMGKAIDTEIKSLGEKYSLFKQWDDQAKASKGQFMSPELEEILETVEKDGVTLAYAVKAYFADHGLPAVIKKAEKDAVDRLTKKAGQKSESGTVSNATPNPTKYHDEESVAEALMKDAKF